MSGIGQWLQGLLKPEHRRDWASDYLNFDFKQKMPEILQTEATECGLACLAMISNFYGQFATMPDLRRRHSISLKGVNIAQLIDVARELNLSSRAVRLELHELDALRTPAILHWNFNHFVVLKHVGKDSITIHDPAVGLRRLRLKEVSSSFTGVALELWPKPDAPKPGQDRQGVRQLSVRSLIGETHGLYTLIGQTVIIAIGIEIFSLILPLMTQWVIDYVIVSSDQHLLTTCVLGFGLVMLIQQALTAMRGWVIMYLGGTLNLQWQGNVLGHLVRLPAEYFQKRHLGDIVSRFGSIEQIQNTISTSFMAAILDGLMSVATLALMLLYSIKLAAVTMIATLLYVVLRTVTYVPLRGTVMSRIVFNAKQQTHFLETLRGIRAIKLFQREELRRLGWLSLFAQQTNASLKAQRAQLVFSTANGLLFGAERILVLWLGALMILDHTFTVGVLMAFVSYKEQFASRIVSLADKYYEFRMLRLHTERLSDIVLAVPDGTGQITGMQPREDNLTIAAHDVRFKYSKNDPDVLKRVSLSVTTGESLAIVGGSGCGKSTLVSVLVGLARPTTGRVTIGGIDINQIDRKVLRNLICAVTQEDTLFAGSIADNISFFDERRDMAGVEEAARLAVIHDDILAMPMGYSTLVGDMGSALSGGQKQRILIARALYRRPKILVLDEATSHLDLEREAAILFNLRSLKITRILVAHRPETFRSADRILSLEGGTAKLLFGDNISPLHNARAPQGQLTTQ